MKVIVSGATSVVGMALPQKLKRNNAEIAVLCHRGFLQNRRLDNFEGINRIVCDLDDIQNLQNEENLSFDVFYHFAWSGTTGAGRIRSGVGQTKTEFISGNTNMANNRLCIQSAVWHTKRKCSLRHVSNIGIICIAKMLHKRYI